MPQRVETHRLSNYQYDHHYLLETLQSALLENKINSMSAAQTHKDNINKSRRRVNGIVGEPNAIYVNTARKPVLKTGLTRSR
jgi:hypothetical protein